MFEHRRPAEDRLAVASISGIVSRHAGRTAVYGDPSPAEIAAAVAELEERGLTRPDLLAEWAGISLGAAEGDVLAGKLRRAEAAILVAAGADQSLIPHWTQVGRERRTRGRRAVPQFPGHADARED